MAASLREMVVSCWDMGTETGMSEFAKPCGLGGGL
jgi:hypothetical protein